MTLFMLFAKWKYEDQPMLVGIFDSTEQIISAKTTYCQAYDDYLHNQITFVIEKIKLNEVNL